MRKRKSECLKYCNNPEAFIEYLSNIDNIYGNIE